MAKDFDDWNEIKKNIHARCTENLFFKEREVWWCSLGVNVGFEQDGKNEKFSRPVLILKKFSKDVFWALPLTLKNKSHRYYYHFSFLPKIISSAILPQLRLCDSKRLISRIAMVSHEDYEKIKKAVREIL